MSALAKRLTSGVFVYRSIADLENIIKYAEQDYVTRAEVIGGGVSPSRRPSEYR
jgi:NAD(P)H-nitrite reductase large subunit